MSIQEEKELKHVGMWLAASSKRESLEKARAYLITLSLERANGEVCADDARNFITRAGLKPLGNAAGSLFAPKKIWEFVGWKSSECEGNHAHKIMVWRLKRGYDGVGDDPGPETVSTASKKMLTPSQAKRELAALTDLYESSSADDMPETLYAALKSDIFERMK